MAHTFLFDNFARAARLAFFGERERISTIEAIERVDEMEKRRTRRLGSRREFLANAGRVTALGMLASLTNPPRSVYAAASPSIGIVGAGLAGLVCADRLRQAGIQATVYDAGTSIGGRCTSLRGVFPGRTIELGGEFIDQSHKTILKIVRRLGLTQLNLFKSAGEVVYRIDGQIFPEQIIVDLFRDSVHQMEKDARTVTSGLNARLPFTPNDRRLDTTNLEEYLFSIRADPLLVKAIQSVYGGEYGQPIHQQSCLNFLLFVKLSRSRHIHWFGATNAERLTIIEGNDAIAKGLADGLEPGQIQLGMNLSAVRKATDGRIVLTFGQTDRTHDAVVLAIPATVIRNRVALHSNLGIAPLTRSAIERLQYGDNTKTMYQFTSNLPFGTQLGGDGTSYTTDPALPNLQVTFPSKTGAGNPSRPVIVDYSFGIRGRNQQSVDPDGELFLRDLDEVFPGAWNTVSRRPDGSPFHVRKHWPSDPNALGSYTCNQPGYFTEMEGWLAEPAANLFFAGEHTDSFHNFQGFLEGAASSGEHAAGLLLDRMNARKSI